MLNKISSYDSSRFGKKNPLPPGKINLYQRISQYKSSSKNIV